MEWGDGDSLDRERVRDILLEEYNYKFVGGIMRLSKFLTENLETKTVNLTLTFDERSELLRHLEMFDENIDQLHPLVESVQDKLLGID